MNQTILEPACYKRSTAENTAKKFARGFATSGASPVLEKSEEGIQQLTIPRIIASRNPELSAEFIKFLLSRDLSTKVLCDLAMETDFVQTAYNGQKLITVFALHCTGSDEDQQTFAEFYRRIEPHLTLEQKQDLYLDYNKANSVAGDVVAKVKAVASLKSPSIRPELRGGFSFLSVVAEQFPQVLDIALQNLTTLHDTGLVSRETLDHLLASTNRNLVARAPRAAAADEESPLLSPSTTLHFPYTGKTLRDLLKEKKPAVLTALLEEKPAQDATENPPATARLPKAAAATKTNSHVCNIS